MGLYEFYRNEELTDWTVSINGRRHRCHRVILAHRSQYFRAILRRVDAPPEVCLSFPFDVDLILPQLLYYFYEGHLPKEISIAESIPLLVVAAQLEVHTLRVRLEASLLSALTTAKAALSFLARINRMVGDFLPHFEGIQSKSIQLIAQGLESVWEELHLLNPQQVSAVLSTPDCAKDGALISHTITQFVRRRVELAKELSVSGQTALSQADFACLCNHVTDIHPNDIMVLLGLSIRLKDKRMRKKCLVAAAQYADDLDWDPDCGLDDLAALPCASLVEKHVSQRAAFVQEDCQSTAEEPREHLDASLGTAAQFAMKVTGRKRTYFKASQVTQEEAQATEMEGSFPSGTNSVDVSEALQGEGCAHEERWSTPVQPPTSSNVHSDSQGWAPGASEQGALLWQGPVLRACLEPEDGPSDQQATRFSHANSASPNPGTPPRSFPAQALAPSVQSSQALFSQASARLQADGGPGGAKRARLHESRAAGKPVETPIASLASAFELPGTEAPRGTAKAAAVEDAGLPDTEGGPWQWTNRGHPPTSAKGTSIAIGRLEEEVEEEEDCCSQGMALMLQQINGAIDAHQRRRHSQVVHLLQEEVGRLEDKIRAGKSVAQSERVQFSEEMEVKLQGLEASLDEARSELAAESKIFHQRLNEVEGRYSAASRTLELLRGEIHCGITGLAEKEEKFFVELKETIESDLVAIDTNVKQVSQKHTMQLLSKVLSMPASQLSQCS